MPKQPTTTRPVETTVIPGSGQWAVDLRVQGSDQAIGARTQLGLGTDRPIIASGHQSVIFHPGIVAKLIALDHWSKKVGASPVWIVPDQDVIDPGLIRVPVQGEGSLRVQEVRIGGEPNHSLPAVSMPAISIRSDLPERFESVASWLMGYEHESSIARQFARATIGMLCEQLDLQEPEILFASDLFALDASRALVDALLLDPVGAVRSYNSSVAQFPDAGVRPLRTNGSRVELPFWRLDVDGRLPVYAQKDQPGVDRARLIPRGLMMTAIMRAFLCDLFIHGTGGYEYDQITEAWMREMYDQPLSPIAAVSATMRLGFNHTVPQDPDRAVWRAHHARHNPSMIGDQQTAQQKAELVSAIADSKANGNSSATAELFSQLHKLLVESRINNAKAINGLDKASERARRDRKAHAVANDRTWAFPLYADDQLRSLKDEIVRALEAED